MGMTNGIFIGNLQRFGEYKAQSLVIGISISAFNFLVGGYQILAVTKLQYKTIFWNNLSIT